MNIVKVSSSGQITLPKFFRIQYNTKLFQYRIEDNKFIVVPIYMSELSNNANFSIKNDAERFKKMKKKYTIKDLKKGMFHSSNKNVHDFSENIDSIISQQ